MTKEIFTHFSSVNRALETIDPDDLQDLIDRLTEFFRGRGTLFVGGNGGSQSISEHISTDWTKGVFTDTKKKLRVLPLNSVNSVNTAIANDLGYEYSLSFNFELLAREGDAILLISSSGKSPNIIRAVASAKKNGHQVFAFSGFGESPLYRSAESAITVESQDYQVIEDVHAILGHAIFKHLIKKI